MNKYIKGIIVFKDSNSKSIIQFNEGINIITGESKTGKSALIDIIDYCLCSNSNTVPKGVIKNYASLYVLVICIGSKTLAIARRQSDGKMSFIIDDSTLNIDNIKIEDFDSFSKHKDIQKIIEENLGLNVTNLNSNPFIKNKGKASIRNMLSYNFQHQNHIASRFSLFYRFDDSEKRDQVIEQFPIFAGVVDQQYYSTLIELKESEQELKNITRRKEMEEASYNKIFKDLIPVLEQYYSLIGQDLPENIKKFNFGELIKFSKNLPSSKINFIDKDIIDNYSNIKANIDVLNNEISNIKLKIDNLNSTDGDIYSYLNSINGAISVEVYDANVEFKCPLCNNNVDEINLDKNKLLLNQKILQSEKSFAQKSSKQFLDEKRKLSKLLSEKKKDMILMAKEVKYIEDHYINNDELKDNNEKILNARLRIHYSLEVLLDKSYSSYNEKIKELENKIEELNIILNNFNIDGEMKKIENEINTNMNKLAKTLDFEEEFLPTNLHLNLTTFDLYHLMDGEKIGLGEMGSGANWLSCHVALFLSLLRVFTRRHAQSPMLLFLFFDQPSQVYFPDEHSEVETKDILAISRIFKTIFDEFDSIDKETGIMPQLILTEHVRGSILKEISSEYEEKTIKHWSDSTGKFITE